MLWCGKGWKGRAMSDGKKLAPKLRFPEFRGEWECEKVDSLVETITPPKKLPTSSYGPKGSFPIIDQSQNEICGWTDDHEALIQDDLPLIVFGDHTCILKFVGQPFAQGADGIKILKSRSKVSTSYLYQFLSYQPVVTEEYKRHFSILKEKVVLLPDFKTGEQQKIADCLTSLDELIAALARKVEALKTHKKGLMQQLFPREGETQPRLRFPEFREAGEWEERTMGSLASFSSGGTPSKDNPQYWNGSIPWVSASSMYDLVVEKADHYVTPLAIGNGTRIAKKGSILILVRGSMLFKRVPICIAGVDVAFNQDVKALGIEPSIDNKFLLYQLSAFQSRLPINETGIGAGKIELAHLKGFELFIPDKPEQQRIASCLSSLDALITAETQKLETLKTHEKGLMQQLFPSPYEASA